MQTANTVDFVTMYPSFDQSVLLQRLQDSLEEAWEWELLRAEERSTLRKDGWVHLTNGEARRPALGLCTKEEVSELVSFVIGNE